LRELRRILDLNAGRELSFDLCDHKFIISHLIEDDEKIRIEDFETREVFVSDTWSEICRYFDNKDFYFRGISKRQLYVYILGLVIQAFMNQKLPRKDAKTDLLQSLASLVEDEPLLKKTIKSL